MSTLAVKDNKPTASGWAAILTVFMILGSLSIATPALRTIGASFPDVSPTTISLCSTLPGLFCIPTVLLCGILVDRGFRFKPIILIGCVAYVVVGIIPFFVQDNFTVILVDRALFGLALGITTPLANAAVLRWYKGPECAKKAGQGVAVMLLLTVFFQIGCGYLAAIHWKYVFLIHLLGIVPLVTCLIAWPEPEKIIKSAKAKAAAGNTANAQPAEKDKINLRAIWVYLAFWLNCAMVSVILLNSSYFISIKGFGESVLAGYFGATVTFTGFIFGMLFGAIVKKFGRFTVGIGLILSGIGMFLIYAATNGFILMLGAVVVGIGFCIPQPGLTYELGLFIPQSWVSTASAIQMAMKHFSNFLAGYFIALVGLIIAGADQVTVVIAAAIIIIVVGVIFCIVRIFNKLPEAK